MMEERRGERDGEGGAGGCGWPAARGLRGGGCGSRSETGRTGAGEVTEGKVRGKWRPEGEASSGGRSEEKQGLPESPLWLASQETWEGASSAGWSPGANHTLWPQIPYLPMRRLSSLTAKVKL